MSSATQLSHHRTYPSVYGGSLKKNGLLRACKSISQINPNGLKGSLVRLCRSIGLRGCTAVSLAGLTPAVCPIFVHCALH